MSTSLKSQHKFPIKLHHYEGELCTILDTIHRKIWAESIGNFNPLFCTYKGKRTLLHSDEGDLSDPLRRDDTYKRSLYIKV